MARTIAEIKTGLGNAYIAQEQVQINYGLTADDVALGFDNLFSKVSPESLLFYAVAFAINLFELIMDSFRSEIQATIDASYVANTAWWHAQSKAFQRGYNLILNSKTFKYEYAAIDADVQIIKRVAVRETVPADGSCKLQLLLATETNGAIAPLSEADLAMFSIYANTIKPGGVLLQIISSNGDAIDLAITVNYNPLILSSTGQLITADNYPVSDAVNNFINTLNDSNFGGKLNITRLIDAIQSADGVVDAKITELQINNVVQSENWGTFESTNGWFALNSAIITYQPQTQL